MASQMRKDQKGGGQATGRSVPAQKVPTASPASKDYDTGKVTGSEQAIC